MARHGKPIPCRHCGHLPKLQSFQLLSFRCPNCRRYTLWQPLPAYIAPLLGIGFYLALALFIAISVLLHG